MTQPLFEKHFVHGDVEATMRVAQASDGTYFTEVTIRRDPAHDLMAPYLGDRFAPADLPSMIAVLQQMQEVVDQLWQSYEPIEEDSEDVVA